MLVKTECEFAPLPAYLLLGVSSVTCLSVSRSADRHRGLQDSSSCPACLALPGALHPAASAHHGLPEGTMRGGTRTSQCLAGK